MAEVGHYAMIYSNVLIGAQVCMFAAIDSSPGGS
jgi:hypothetical protein